MVGSVLMSIRRRPWAALGLWLLACIIAQTASAADCPGHPDALGTSRTLVVDPKEHPRIGAMQYAETLPLRDHEVVLTFDDGPLPRNSNQVLDILASQCVKATFFTIGRMAQAAGILMLRRSGCESKTAFFMSADKVKFRKPVRPGDQLVIRAKLLKARGDKLATTEAECTVNGEVVSSANLMFALIDAGDLD